MVLAAIAKAIFGSANDRQVKQVPAQGRRHQRARSRRWPSSPTPSSGPRPTNSAQAYKDGKTLDDLLVPAFAVVREASKRTLGMRHFDVQLVGGMVLNDRSIAEMRTGEGKTLVATLPVYLNALTGKGVHVVTVNDYLAKRDSRVDGPDLQLPRASPSASSSTA